MTLIATRSGIPKLFFETIQTTGRDLGLTSQTNFLKIRNTGANVLRFYVSQEDFDADANFISIAGSGGLEEGPYEMGRVWLRAVSSSTTVEIIAFLRRN